MHMDHIMRCTTSKFHRVQRHSDVVLCLIRKLKRLNATKFANGLTDTNLQPDIFLQVHQKRFIIDVVFVSDHERE